MLKTRFGFSRKIEIIKRNVAKTSALGATKLSPSDDNIFKKRQPIRDSPFSGRIYDTLMKEFDADSAFDSRENIEIEKMKTNRLGNMRGSHAITRTTWWLGQGPHLIPEVAAINLELLEPDYDHAGLSTGLFEYMLYYIPQLRFKNRQAIITVSRNECAAPFIQFFFKDGRNCHVDCTNASLGEIKQHIEATFCQAKGEHKDSIEDTYDSNGRHTNPYMHFQNKPITNANQYRLRRKCLCQQPGQYGCQVGCADDYADHIYTYKMPGNHLIEDNMWKRYSQREYWSENPRKVSQHGAFLSMKSHQQGEEDYRPMYSHEQFRNYCKDMEGRENRQIGKLVEKIRMNRHYRHIKDINHKKIHNHWSKYFWGVESGLTEDWDEFLEYVTKENANLARDYTHKGNKQGHNKKLFMSLTPPIMTVEDVENRTSESGERNRRLDPTEITKLNFDEGCEFYSLKVPKGFDIKKLKGYEIFEGRTEFDNGIEINCKLQSNNYVLTGSKVSAKKLKTEKLNGEIVVHEFDVPGVRRFKFIPKVPYPIVEENPDRSQIALTGMTDKPMASNDPEEGVKSEIGATPKKRKKKTKDVETPSRKKVKKTSVKTELTE